jgi:hypothetical protein
MQQNKTSFFIIIGLAVVIVLGMIGATFFLGGSLGDSSVLQQEVEIQVVAAPLIKPWVERMAQEFNQANPKTQVKVVTASSLIPAGQFGTGDPQSPPSAWVAEASFVVEMARAESLQFETGQSVASTALAWGGYKNKLDPLGELSWQNLHDRAASEGLKLVIASPQNSAEGIAALLSATAAHLNTQSLSRQEVSPAIGWLNETLGNRNAHTPPTPAEAFASTQGRTLGDAGLLSTASWRAVKLDQSADFLIQPAQPEVILDYPYAVWTGSQSTPETQAAARAFRSFLLENSQQSRLTDFFFEPAPTAQTGVQADGEAAEQLQSWASRAISVY